MQSILHNCEPRLGLTAVAAGQTTQVTAGVKMDDCEGVCFLAVMGAITANGVQSIKLQQSDDDGSADNYSDIEGSSVTIGDGDDNKVVPIEIYRPTKLWVRASIQRATQDSVINSVVALKYGLKKAPHAAHSTALAGKTLAGPAEGTA